MIALIYMLAAHRDLAVRLLLSLVVAAVIAFAISAIAPEMPALGLHGYISFVWTAARDGQQPWAILSLGYMIGVVLVIGATFLKAIRRLVQEANAGRANLYVQRARALPRVYILTLVLGLTALMLAAFGVIGADHPARYAVGFLANSMLFIVGVWGVSIAISDVVLFVRYRRSVREASM